MTRPLLIGVDVGGTNTDSVLIDPTQFEEESKGVLAWNKMATTSDVSEGIERGITKLLEDQKSIQKEEIVSVTIGTTHFINAVVEQDQARLDKVAVLRLCGPYSENAPPFSDFPAGLTHILKGYVGFVNGGYHVDGSNIRPIKESEVLEHIATIKKLGLKSVAIIGIFSPMNPAQEIKVRDIIIREIPGINVTISSDVSGIGYLERENATILNAATLNFAGKIIASFLGAIKNLGLSCPLFLTQNDGTVLPATECIRLPIRTFSSGTTNSIRGASFLSNLQGSEAIVVDVGGTTTDIGLLLKTGFPRQSASYSIVGGVRMNFSMPHVESFGLGGGSYVRGDSSKMTIGPDSAGYDIVNQALTFGGDRITATDVSLSYIPSLSVGDPTKVSGKFSSDYQATFQVTVKGMLERVIDRMKTSPADIIVLAVGGGSFMVPETLEGALEVIKPPYYSVANAIGAAMGKISSEVQFIKRILPGSSPTKEDVIKQITESAIKKATSKGALLESVTTAFLSAEPVPYVDNTVAFHIKMIADVDYKNVGKLATDLTATYDSPVESEAVYKDTAALEDRREEEVDYISYKPTINSERQWLLSETDLEFITLGCYILGSGGGGNPYSFFLEARNLMRKGDTLTVIDVKDAPKYVEGEGSIASVCYAGSPTVSHEQLSGHALQDCYEYMGQLTHKKPELLFTIEIGGGNGLSTFEMSSSSRLNIPVVDCDLMGRAYPTHWQTIPVVYTDPNECFYTPLVFGNGNGNTLIISESKNDVLVEKCMRAALSEIGCTVGLMNAPMTLKELQERTIHGSLSLCWRIGRAIKIARQKSEIDTLPQAILKSIDNSGKLLFTGKIIGVDRKLMKGHAYGEVTIEELDPPKRHLMIPFKNENIYCKMSDFDGSSSNVICSVPDLIAVIDADTGEALGTQDYRYGIIVFVLGIAPSNKWTDSERAISIGGPKGFDLDMEYHPVSVYSPPVSVIDEYE